MNVSAPAAHSAGPAIPNGLLIRPPSHALLAQLPTTPRESLTFASMLRRARFTAGGEAVASPSNISNTTDALLLRPSSTVLLSLVASVREHVEEAEGRAAAAAQARRDSTGNVRTFTLDSGSQINLLTLETAKEFFS